jgi:predicted TIM-barrel fold metal-dependent hydrolase
MRGIRLHPNYHGYTLADPVFSELLNLAAARGLVVQLALCMEDERTQHPLMRIPPVDLAPLSELVKAVPKLRFELLNCYPQIKFDQLRRLAVAENIYFEISMAEGVGVVARWIGALGLKRIVFGSHYPFFYLESALLKMQESGLDESQKTAIFADNAKKLLA